MSAFGASAPDDITRREFVAVATSAPLAIRALRGMSAERVVVVGAGAFGGWSALALLRAGYRVTLVDAWGAGHARASSGGETRVIRGVYNGVVAYTQMAARAFTLWREAEAHWGRRVYHRTGTLWMCGGDDGYVRRSVEPMRAAGLPLEELTLDEVRRRFPRFALDDVRTAWWEPEAGFLTARVACELVRETFVREGGEYVQGEAGPAVVATNRLGAIGVSAVGRPSVRLEADHWVYACGPWLPRVIPELGRRIVATRQEVVFFGTPAGDPGWNAGAMPTWVHLGERLVYGLPDFERRGIKIADDTAGPEVDPTTMDRAPSAAGLANARAILRARFPTLADAPVTEARVCQYEASSDGHFIVDRHPMLHNVWLAGGGSGHGFKMGPALGEHVAALVQGRAQVHPLFAYDRLKLRG